MKIISLIGREIYDSRGWPTLECEVVLEDGFRSIASVPTGLSKGRYEAKSLYDTDRLFGHGVNVCKKIIDTIIAPALIGKKPHALDMDLELLSLDGTQNKSHIGANTTLAVSMAIYRAHAHIENIELFELIGHICGAESVSLPFPFF